MIPVKLTLKGLYSYKESQTIDFTSLTAAGLFGIFGSVGSGKSSLLEAILLALYGSTERLSDKGEKTAWSISKVIPCKSASSLRLARTM